MTQRIIFVSGTDTGAGKTVLTALLLAHLQTYAPESEKIVALKPFCSGGRDDALILWELQNRVLPIDLVNPFYFAEPLSPWSAARLAGKKITLEQTLAHLRAADSTVLLIEGAGGLLAPLGEQFCALDLIRELDSEVIIAAGNKLGVLNHALLTISALRNHKRNCKVALMDLGPGDPSSKRNLGDLRELAGTVPVESVPFINLDPTEPVAAIRKAATSLAPVLERLVATQ